MIIVIGIAFCQRNFINLIANHIKIMLDISV